jgi:hypothetical protein
MNRWLKTAEDTRTKARPISFLVKEIPVIERKLKSFGIETTPELVEEIEQLMAKLDKVILEKGVKSYDDLIKEVISVRVSELETEIARAKDKETVNRLINAATALKKILEDEDLKKVIINHIVYSVLNKVFDLITAQRYDEARKLVEKYNLFYDSLSEDGKDLIRSVFTHASLLNQAAIVAVFKLGGKFAESYITDILDGKIPGGDKVYPLLIELLPKETVVRLVKEHVLGGSGDVQKDVQSVIIKYILRDEWDRVKLIYMSLGNAIDWNIAFNYVVRNLLRLVDNIWSVVSKLKSIKPDFKLSDDTMLLIFHYLMASGQYSQILNPDLVSVLTDDQKVKVLKELARQGRTDLVLQFLDMIDVEAIPDAEKIGVIDALLVKGVDVDDVQAIAARLGTLSDSQKIEIFKQLVPLDYPAARKFVKTWNLDLEKVPKDLLDAYVFSAAAFGDFDEALSFTTAPVLFNQLLSNTLYEQAYDLAKKENIQIPLDVQLDMLEHFHRKGDKERAEEIGNQIKLPRSRVRDIPYELFQYIKQIEEEQKPNA